MQNNESLGPNSPGPQNQAILAPECVGVGIVFKQMHIHDDMGDTNES